MKKQANKGAAPESNTDQENLHSILNHGNPADVAQWLMENGGVEDPAQRIGRLRHAIQERVVAVGQRTYNLRLMAVPLVGNVRVTSDALQTTKALLTAAKQRKILGAEDGVVMLNVVLSRGPLLQIPMQDLYALPARLFAHGAQGRSDQPVLEHELHEKDTISPAAVLLVLLYWKTGTEQPAILTDQAQQIAFGKLIGEFVEFEQSASGESRGVWGCRLQPFFDAVSFSTESILRAQINRVMSSPDVSKAREVSVELCLIDDDAGGRVSTMFSLDGKQLPIGHGIMIDPLLDGNMGQMAERLERICREVRPDAMIQKPFKTMIQSGLTIDDNGIMTGEVTFH